MTNRLLRNEVNGSDGSRRVLMPDSTFLIDMNRARLIANLSKTSKRVIFIQPNAVKEPIKERKKETDVEIIPQSKKEEVYTPPRVVKREAEIQRVIRPKADELYYEDDVNSYIDADELEYEQQIKKEPIPSVSYKRLAKPAIISVKEEKQEINSGKVYYVPLITEDTPKWLDGSNKKRFDINKIGKLDLEDSSIDVNLLEKATTLVKSEMTDIKGTQKEIEEHNLMLMKCAVGDKSAQGNVKAKIKKIIEKDYQLAQPPLSDILVKKIYEDNYGLGAIDDLVMDTTINEIWVNGYDHIWIEKAGKKYRLHERRFKNDADVIRVIGLLLAFDKKDVTRQKPSEETRMMDGSRITVSIPDIAKRPYINIRKFDAFELNDETLLESGALTDEMIGWLERVVRGRANILIIGETGSGKTSFLKWLVDFIDPNLRLGTIESNFELKLDEKYPDRNVFALEQREELGITMADLFKLCLRSTPDIIIVGEARGLEAGQLIDAMRRGHKGSIGTIHTNEAETAIDDLMEMINIDGRRRDPHMLRYRIASAIDIIIQIKKYKTGERRVARITEVVNKPKSLTYELNDIFRFDVAKEETEAGEFFRYGYLTEPLRKSLHAYGLSYEETLQL